MHKRTVGPLDAFCSSYRQTVCNCFTITKIDKVIKSVILQFIIFDPINLGKERFHFSGEKNLSLCLLSSCFAVTAFTQRIFDIVFVMH